MPRGGEEEIEELLFQQYSQQEAILLAEEEEKEKAELRSEFETMWNSADNELIYDAAFLRDFFTDFPSDNREIALLSALSACSLHRARALRHSARRIFRRQERGENIPVLLGLRYPFASDDPDVEDLKREVFGSGIPLEGLGGENSFFVPAQEFAAGKDGIVLLTVPEAQSRARTELLEDHLGSMGTALSEMNEILTLDQLREIDDWMMLHISCGLVSSSEYSFPDWKKVESEGQTTFSWHVCEMRSKNYRACKTMYVVCQGGKYRCNYSTTMSAL